jgi:hypothetical protein
LRCSGRRFELKREAVVRFVVLRSLILEKVRGVFEKWLGTGPIRSVRWPILRPGAASDVATLPGLGIGQVS